MTALLVSAAILLALVAVALRLAARVARRRAGLSAGRVVYRDAPSPRGAPRTLTSSRFGLAGKPDYLLEVNGGVVPVELKSGSRPLRAMPYDSHLLQLAAYCLLCEEDLGARVRYGIVRYRDGEIRVDYTDELRAELLDVLAEMRATRAGEYVMRSHDEPRRCRRCSFRDVCGEALE